MESINYFIGVSSNDVWLQAIDAIKNESIPQNSRLGNTYEILHANFHIKDPRQRWITARNPSINPAFAIAEVFWILAGRNDAKLINYWNSILPNFAGHGVVYHGAYGYRIRKHLGIDQLERTYKCLLNNPDSRQAVIQIWDSNVDFPKANGQPMDNDIPCNICAMPKIRNGRLEWLQVMRSNDLFRGTPYNIVQFTTLQEILAGWLNIPLGSYHQISDSLHLYEYDIDNINVIENKLNISNTDSLCINKDDFDSILDCSISILERLSLESLTKKMFIKIFDHHNLPQSYTNLLSICACDSARRRGWVHELDVLKSLCDNNLLLYAWNKWEERYPVRKEKKIYE